MGDRPTVLFVCVHNAGRSQMAAALLERAAGERVAVLSAGSEPADRVHPNVLEAMAEIGIDLAGRSPRLMTDADARAADVVVIMGCGDTCPVFPGRRYEDWDVEDPKNAGIDRVREIRTDISQRVERLLEQLTNEDGLAAGETSS